MKKHSNDFGNDSVPGLVLRTSIPFMFAQFVNVLYSIVDRIYIGNIPQIGDVSLAGAGICAPVITLLSSFATLIGIGGSVLFSMRLGAKDQEKAKNLLGTSFSMLLVFSAALTILFLLLKAPLLQWFGASKTTFPYANTYMTIYTLGTFFALLSMGMNYFITAQGYPGLGMATTLIGAVVNIALDPVFIFLLHMNIAGAALATVLAQLSSCVFVLLTLKQKKMPIPLTLAPIRRSTAVRILKMGFSPFFNSCNRQRDHHCPKCSPAAFWRSGIRRHSHHLRNHRTELHAAHHLADARHHRRLPAPHQLQHGCRKG